MGDESRTGWLTNWPTGQSRPKPQSTISAETIRVFVQNIWRLYRSASTFYVVWEWGHDMRDAHIVRMATHSRQKTRCIDGAMRGGVVFVSAPKWQPSRGGIEPAIVNGSTGRAT